MTCTENLKLFQLDSENIYSTPLTGMLLFTSINRTLSAPKVKPSNAHQERAAPQLNMLLTHLDRPSVKIVNQKMFMKRPWLMLEYFYFSKQNTSLSFYKERTPKNGLFFNCRQNRLIHHRETRCRFSFKVNSAFAKLLFLVVIQKTA